MILTDLAHYYDILASDEETGISPLGFSSVNISYILNIGLDGQLLDIIYVFDTIPIGKKEKEVPRKIILPAEIKRPGSNPPGQLLWDNATYIFGLVAPEKLEKDKTYAQRRFSSFRTKNLKFLEGLTEPRVFALKNFLQNYTIQDFNENQILQTKREEILKSTGFMTFQVQGSRGLISDIPEVRNKVINQSSLDSSESTVGQCLVTGDKTSIELIHPPIKRVAGAQSTGGSIVSFNARSYESYGKDSAQGLNAPVGSKATFAYSTALNYLLSGQNPYPSFKLGDATVVYWAESTNKIYEDLFINLFDPKQTTDDESTGELFRDEAAERLMEAISEKITLGKPVNYQAIDSQIDENTKFHVLGLSPNAARISVRFYETSSFKSIADKLVQHHEDLYMGQKFPWSIWRITNETVSKKAKDSTPSPLLAGAVMRSILTGLPYPAALFTGIITRIRADNDDTAGQKINTLRAGIIKACLLRNYRFQPNNPYQEVLTMSLNTESKNQPYLLGRLFAVLEKAQEEAAGTKLNSTIKDRYFTSACANPATTFPVLLRLSQHHIAKAPYGYNLEKRIREIMDSFEVTENPFPRALSLEHQGLFILGYYHQRANFFTRKEDNNETRQEEQDLPVDTQSTSF